MGVWVREEGSGEDFEGAGDCERLLALCITMACLGGAVCWTPRVVVCALTVEGFQVMMESVEDLEGLVGCRHGEELRT